MGTGSDPCQDEMEKKKQSPRLILALCLAVCMGFAASEILKSDPLVRLIPADVLRDFPGKCYSWVNQKWYQPNETWSLKPFCGSSRCTGLRNTKTNKTFLGEEVQDCGLIVDLEKNSRLHSLRRSIRSKGRIPRMLPCLRLCRRR